MSSTHAYASSVHTNPAWAAAGSAYRPQGVALSGGVSAGQPAVTGYSSSSTARGLDATAPTATANISRGSGASSTATATAERDTRRDNVPSYLKPTESCLLPRYINAEQDFIRECFSRSSFKSLHDLPTDIRENLVADAQVELREAALNRSAPSQQDFLDPNKPKPLRYPNQHGATCTTGCFSTFPYESPANSIVDALEIRNRERKPIWYPNQANPSTVPTDMRPTPKYISPADAKRQEEATAAGAESARSDAPVNSRQILDEARNDSARQDYFAAAAASAPLFGPFVPTGPHLNQDRGGATGVCRTTRFSLPEVVAQFKKKLMADWPDSAVDVYVDSDEYIVLEFGLHTIDSINGLRNYMNTACSVEPVISENGLRKVPEVWNHQPGNGCVYYAFRPHWVRTRVTHSYYALRIDQRSAEIKPKHSDEPKSSDIRAQVYSYLQSHQGPSGNSTSQATQQPKDKQVGAAGQYGGSLQSGNLNDSQIA